MPESLLTRIGDITVSFALLEATIQGLMGSLIREHQRIGQILGTYLSFSNLRAATISLYLERHGDDDDFQQLKQLMSEAGKVEEERNRITHSIWGAGDGPDAATRMKITARESRGFDFQGEQYSAERLAGVADQIKAVAGKVARLHVSLIERGKVVNNPGAKMW